MTRIKLIIILIIKPTSCGPNADSADGDVELKYDLSKSGTYSEAESKSEDGSNSRLDTNQLINSYSSSGLSMGTR